MAIFVRVALSGHRKWFVGFLNDETVNDMRQHIWFDHCLGQIFAIAVAAVAAVGGCRCANAAAAGGYSVAGAAIATATAAAAAVATQRIAGNAICCR